jgi:antitoxin (DNA-binding transcriptional repressor) of toxin-antitoxin stability system
VKSANLRDGEQNYHLIGSIFVIDFYIMKKASVADLRNHFRRISAWIENGDSVEIVKRRRPFAHLVPAGPKRPLVKADFAAQLAEVWGAKVFSDAEIASGRADELGENS